jgi:polyhydroxyalkanoate synthesis regulator phasin
MEHNEKLKLMNAAVKPVVEMLTKRLNNRIDAMKAFEPNAMENLPDEVKLMREQQASQLRAVIQELKDLVEILTAMYPNA